MVRFFTEFGSLATWGAARRLESFGRHLARNVAKRSWRSSAALILVGWSIPLAAAPMALSPATEAALRDKVTGANLLLLREVQACRKTAADPFDCLDLMLIAAERDSTYHSYDEQQEGLPSNTEIAVEARNLLLQRYPDADVMIGLEGSTPVDADVLGRMLRAGPNILTTTEPGTGRLLNAIAQRLTEGGATSFASRVLNPTIRPPQELVEQEHGANSLEAARVINNTAAIAAGGYATPEQVARMTKVVAIRTRVLGADHVDTAVAMHNLAAMLGAQGKTAEAIRLARAAHGALLGKLGAGDRRTAVAALALGKLLADDGDVTQGATLMRTAVADLAKTADGSPQLARAYLDLARTDTALAPGDRTALLQQATEILERHDQSAYMASLRTVIERGGGYSSNGLGGGNGELDAAARRAEELALLEKVFKQDRDQALATAYQRTARELLDQKRFDEATAMARKAVALDPYSDAAKVIPVYAAIMQQPMGQSVDVMGRNDVQIMIGRYTDSGRALSTEVVEAHLMMGIDGMKAYGPFGAVSEFEKAAAIVRQRLTGRSNFDAKARRDLEALRPVFRGQVMVNFAAASQLTE